jgi:protein tyrosine phosphatase (PTP) superfamily phosphohydrolase (DUF442 family)
MTEPIATITHYLKLSDRLATAGQPTMAEFTAVQAAGYQIVVNLALPSSTNALPDEAAIVQNLGLEYISIPVQWEQPTIADLRRFLAVLDRDDRPVFVHCAMNMRVSAFVYLYRRLRQVVSPEVALADLHQIWEPNPIWQQFIDQVLAEPNL